VLPLALVAELMEQKELTLEQLRQWESIVRVAKFGLEQGKKTMIVDLDILVAVGDTLQKMTNEVVIRRGLMEMT
jgi:hypothetical protein